MSISLNPWASWQIDTWEVGTVYAWYMESGYDLWEKSCVDQKASKPTEKFYKRLLEGLPGGSVG